MPLTLKLDHIEREMVGPLLDLTPTEHALLVGPPGPGKSTEAALHGQRLARETDMVTCTSESSAASFKGHFMPKGGEFIYHNNPGTVRFSSGGLLIVNEINNLSNDAMDFMHVLLDATGQFTTEDGVKHFRNDGFRVIATMNGWPEELRPAILDRFTLRIPVLIPSKAQLALLPPDVAKVCLRLYKACSREHPNPDFTYRELASFARLRAALGNAELAAHAVTGGKLERTQALIEAILGPAGATTGTTTAKEE